MQKVNLTDKKCATCRWWRPVLLLLVAAFALGTPSFARAFTNDSAIVELQVSKVSKQTNETFQIDYSFRQVPKDAADTRTNPQSIQSCCADWWCRVACGIVILVVPGLMSWIIMRRFFKPHDVSIEIADDQFSSTIQGVITGAFWTLALIIMAMCLIAGICWAVHAPVPCFLIGALLALSVTPVLLLMVAMGALLSAKVHKKE